MPILSTLFGATLVAPIMTIGTSITGFSRIYIFRKSIDWQLVKWYLLPSSVSGFLGAYLLIHIQVDWIQIIIGFILVLSIFQLFTTRNNRSDNFEPISSVSSPPSQMQTGAQIQNKRKILIFVIVGSFIAFLSGLIGGVGPLMNSVYLSFGMTKERLIGTRTMNELFLHLVKLFTYFYLGDFPFLVVFSGVLIGISGILGSIAGKYVLTYININAFKVIVILTMFFSGIVMLWLQRNFLHSLLASQGF